MKKVYRVFFHELGHFIARQINLLKYGGPDIMEIKIFPCERDANEYCGHLRPIIPPNVDLTKPMPIERLPSYLASIPYGCFFQAYYTKEPLNFCFEKYGDDDETKFEANLKSQGLKYSLEDFRNINSLFFEQVTATKKFEKIMKISPIHYLKEEFPGKFSVNIEKLKLDIAPLLEDQIMIYAQLVNDYERLIKSRLTSL